MTEAELIAFLAALPGVFAMTAGPADGSPRIAWGDSFFFYDPDHHPDNRRFPFATIVTKDYIGFDVDSRLDRPGVYRLNLLVGREPFRDLFGFPPAEFATHRDAFDYAAVDRVIPHPMYGQQAWVSIVAPGDASRDQVSELITVAYRRARDRHKTQP